MNSLVLFALVAISTKAFGSTPYFNALTSPYPTLIDDSPPGTFYWKFHATDPGNKPFNYSLESTIQDWLVINASNGITKVKKKIDREAILSIPIKRFHVYATNTDSNQGKLQVFLQIDDVNNKPPVMTNLPSTQNIKEDTSIDSKIFTVAYEDKDDQINGQTEIFINSGNEDGVFRMLNYVVYVNKALDYDNGKRQYVLNITANNTQAPYLHTFGLLTFNVLNADDLGLNFTQKSYQAEVIKGSAVGTPVVAVSAYDLDNLNEKPEYGIIPDSNKGNHYKIDSSTGKISVNGELELGSQTLVVTAKSKKHGLVVAFASITVVATRTLSFEANVQEDKANVTVMDLTMIESSFNVTGASFAILSGNDGNLFEIISNKLKVGSVVVDRESRSTYKVVIGLTKNGTLVGQATININVEDINDNWPQFEPPSYVVYVNEDLAVGKDIVKVTAVDSDYGLNGTVTYIITSQQDLFQIDNSSGQISLLRSLDHEKASIYVITVQTNDGGLPPKTNSTNVTINVQDVNDNSPVITPTIMSFTVLENAKVGTQVAVIVAKDADKGQNANISYSIHEGAKGHFTIDSRTGAITTSALLSYKQNPSYMIVVVAEDHGSSPRSTAVFVNLTVYAVHENNYKPVFKQQTYIGGIYQETCCNQEILAVSAVDGDSGVYGEVRYDIITGGQLFYMDHKTGQLQTAGSFENKEGEKYNLVVQASDKASSPKVSDPNARVVVMVLRESRSVGITTGVSHDYLLTNKQEFKSVLDNLTNARAYIKDVLSGSAVNTTLVIFNAVDDKHIDDLIEKDYNSIAGTLGSKEKQNLINGKYKKWRIQYGRPRTSARTKIAASAMSAVQGAVVCLAVMIGIGGIIMIVILIKKKRERQRVRKAARVKFNDKPQFIDPISKSDSRIDNAQEAQEVIVHMDEETSSEVSDEICNSPMEYFNDGYHLDMNDDGDGEREDFYVNGENVNFSTFLPPPPPHPPPALPNFEGIDSNQESEEESMSSVNGGEVSEETEHLGAVLPPHKDFADHTNAYHDDLQHYSESPTHSVTDSTTNLLAPPSSYTNSPLHDPSFGFAGGLRASINEDISTEL